MKSLVLLISGRGSNLEAIVHASRAEAWPARIAGVVANRPQAAGLATASALGLPTAVVDHTEFPSREAFEAALADVIDRLAGALGEPAAPDLVVLAGFMRVLTPGFVARYEGRLINIHPSLLPAFPGLHTHRRALAAGCAFVGATVHAVTADLDHGPIAGQAVVPVLPGDTEHTLAERVLEREHVLYPRVLRGLVTGRLVLRDGRYCHLDGEPLGL
jgi:phosphoribosylglycinamide formyltransferase 1